MSKKSFFVYALMALFSIYSSVASFNPTPYEEASTYASYALEIANKFEKSEDFVSAMLDHAPMPADSSARGEIGIFLRRITELTDTQAGALEDILGLIYKQLPNQVAKGGVSFETCRLVKEIEDCFDRYTAKTDKVRKDELEKELGVLGGYMLSEEWVEYCAHVYPVISSAGANKAELILRDARHAETHQSLLKIYYEKLKVNPPERARYLDLLSLKEEEICFNLPIIKISHSPLPGGEGLLETFDSLVLNYQGEEKKGIVAYLFLRNEEDLKKLYTILKGYIQDLQNFHLKCVIDKSSVNLTLGQWGVLGLHPASLRKAKEYYPILLKKLSQLALIDYTLFLRKLGVNDLEVLNPQTHISLREEVFRNHISKDREAIEKSLESFFPEDQEAIRKIITETDRKEQEGALVLQSLLADTKKQRNSIAKKKKSRPASTKERSRESAKKSQTTVSAAPQDENLVPETQAVHSSHTLTPPTVLPSGPKGKSAANLKKHKRRKVPGAPAVSPLPSVSPFDPSEMQPLTVFNFDTFPNTERGNHKKKNRVAQKSNKAPKKASPASQEQLPQQASPRDASPSLVPKEKEDQQEERLLSEITSNSLPDSPLTSQPISSATATTEEREKPISPPETIELLSPESQDVLKEKEEAPVTLPPVSTAQNLGPTGLPKPAPIYYQGMPAQGLYSFAPPYSPYSPYPTYPPYGYGGTLYPGGYPPLPPAPAMVGPGLSSVPLVPVPGYWRLPDGQLIQGVWPVPAGGNFVPAAPACAPPYHHRK